MHQAMVVVDDDPHMCVLMVRSLRRAGCHVVTVKTGPDALRLAPSALDLLVTDLEPPGTTGPDLADALASQRSGLRVLFVTESGAVDRQSADYLWDGHCHVGASGSRVTA